jgi:hypothetical protein
LAISLSRSAQRATSSSTSPVHSTSHVVPPHGWSRWILPFGAGVLLAAAAAAAWVLARPVPTAPQVAPQVRITLGHRDLRRTGERTTTTGQRQQQR